MSLVAAAAFLLACLHVRLSYRPCINHDCSPLTAVTLMCAGSSSLLLLLMLVCASLLLFVFCFESLSFLLVDLACTSLATISLLPFLARAHAGSPLFVVTRPLLFVRRLVSLHSSLSLPALNFF